MAAPVLRGQTAPVTGLSVNSPASTQIGDLVIVYTFERLGAGVASTLSLGGAMDGEIINHFHNDGSTDGALAAAYKVATAAGVQAYQGFTSSTGSPVAHTGCLVLEVGTFDEAGILSTSASQTNNATPNPPALGGLDSARDYFALTVAAWHFGSSLSNTAVAPSGYTNLVQFGGAATLDLACASTTLSGVTAVDPAAWGDNQAPNGTCSLVIAVPSVLPIVEADITEAATAEDSASAGLIFTDDITESGVATDSSEVEITLGASVTEAAAAADTGAVQQVANSSLTEAAVAVDAGVAGLLVAAGLSEAATAGDSASAVLVLGAEVSEAGQAQDAPTVAAVMGVGITEAAAADDSQNADPGAVGAVTEAANATEVVEAQQVSEASISEAAAASDSASCILVLSAEVTEVAAATEQAGTLSAVNVEITESADAVDEQVGQAIGEGGAGIVEAVDASDGCTAQLNAVADVVEVAAAIEIFGVQLVANVTHTAAAAALDTLSVIQFGAFVDSLNGSMLAPSRGNYTMRPPRDLTNDSFRLSRAMVLVEGRIMVIPFDPRVMS
jgi:hypothetical protein